MTKTLCFYLLHIFILCICKDWKCAPLNNNLMWIYKLIHVSITSEKKTNEKQQKQWKKLPCTLINILVAKPWTFLLASFFGLDQLNSFQTKWYYVNAISNWLELLLDPNLKSLCPIYDFQPIGLLYFVGPYPLDPT
jgi:hypothetical protein